MPNYLRHSSEEAVSLLRTLSTDNTHRHTNDLAIAMHNQALNLSSLGQYRDALPLHEETVSLLRTLSTDNTHRHNGNLAIALRDKAAALSLDPPMDPRLVASA